jgi:hypothetical protein
MSSAKIIKKHRTRLFFVFITLIVVLGTFSKNDIKRLLNIEEQKKEISIKDLTIEEQKALIKELNILIGDNEFEISALTEDLNALKKTLDEKYKLGVPIIVDTLYISKNTDGEVIKIK